MNQTSIKSLESVSKHLDYIRNKYTSSKRVMKRTDWRLRVKASFLRIWKGHLSSFWRISWMPRSLPSPYCIPLPNSQLESSPHISNSKKEEEMTKLNQDRGICLKKLVMLLPFSKDNRFSSHVSGESGKWERCATSLKFVDPTWSVTTKVPSSSSSLDIDSFVVFSMSSFGFSVCSFAFSSSLSDNSSISCINDFGEIFGSWIKCSKRKVEI